jgi:hypothetical protein
MPEKKHLHGVSAKEQREHEHITDILHGVTILLWQLARSGVEVDVVESEWLLSRPTAAPPIWATASSGMPRSALGLRF